MDNRDIHRPGQGGYRGGGRPFADRQGEYRKPFSLSVYDDERDVLRAFLEMYRDGNVSKPQLKKLEAYIEELKKLKK